MGCNTNAFAIGGLPALKPVSTTITLSDPTGYVMDTFSYKVPVDAGSTITYKASETISKEVRTWQLYTDR
jgi:hypothetical protein